MASDDLTFLSRDELLGGLPARRASTLLYAIENRTAHLVARSRRAMATYETEQTVEEEERAFFEAFAQGREPPIQPAIQDLERYAPEWASLVPPDPGVRAAMARMIGDKYTVPRRAVPSLRRALGLDDKSVGEAYRRLHSQPIDSLYASHIHWRERLRWTRASFANRLETLPPFWTAFALTLTETVGAGILALPIAVAEIGAIGGLVFLLILGLVNVLTIAAISESVARNGNVRYGRAYFGRLVTDYLGRPGAWLLNPALLLINVVLLLAYFVGFSSTLADSTGLPAEGFVALLFVLALVLLRKSLDATVASALAVGAASISLIILLSLLALPHVEGANLRHSQIPFVGGEPFDASVLELIFGVVLGAYFGHTSAAVCAGVVLQRDPTARSFIRGSVAALATTIGLYCIWVVAVNGVVAPETLASATGTALEPLAVEVGPSVDVLGSIFVVLAMGMASIHVSRGLFNQMREWLPSRRTTTHHSRQESALRVVLGEVGFWLGALPIIAIFIAVEVLLVADRASFASLLGFLGAIAAPILAGIFPMLMLAASRRKGDCVPGEVWRLIGHPVVVGAIYFIFLTALILHGLVIWQEPYERAAALLTSAAAVAVTLAALRRGAFHPRAVVEVRTDSSAPESAVVNFVVVGQLAPADVKLVYHQTNGSASSLRKRSDSDGTLSSAQVDLPPAPVRQLKVWAHRLLPEGSSEGLPANFALSNSDGRPELEQGLIDGQLVVPVTGEAMHLEIKVGT
jgi:amino acid permease